MYLYNKTNEESRSLFQCENRSLLPKPTKRAKNAEPRPPIELAPVNLPKWLLVWLVWTDTFRRIP